MTRDSRARWTRAALVCFALALMIYGCSASDGRSDSSGSGAGIANGTGVGGGALCGDCFGQDYTPCNDDGSPGMVVTCPEACVPGEGCLDCMPGETVCVGNEVHICDENGNITSEVVETCDVSAGLTCSDGACLDACIVAEDQPSNIGCTFWAVDMDQVDAFNDPASAPWGVALSNAGQAQANVTIEINEAPPGEPLDLMVVEQLSVAPGELQARVLPTREIDCGLQPNDYAAPGTCLSSRAYRITSSAPIVVYQYNVFENAFSNDASLLLPENALGTTYRVMGWPAGHPVDIGFGIIDRSAVTVLGTAENTIVTIKPSWRIRGNPPIDATPAGGTITVTIGPFDVLNIETDNGTFQDDPNTVADLSGTIVTSTKPVAVFSGVESTQAPYGSSMVSGLPTYPGWDPDSTCCLDHLEDQMFPVESVGNKYVITRSPIRSTGSWHEPDVLRFMGVAETANVTTSLPAPYDNFTLQPGEVRTTWTQTDVTVQSDKPVMVGQLLISQGYIDGALTGDPALTVFPPVEQFRTEYIILTPGSWTTNWVVIAAEVGSSVTIDGSAPGNCLTTTIGTLDGTSYESRRCPLAEGAHNLSGDAPFGVVAYGYGSAGSYAFAGGADVERIYEPPPLE